MDALLSFAGVVLFLVGGIIANGLLCLIGMIFVIIALLYGGFFNEGSDGE